MINKLIKLSRRNKKALMLLFDIIAIIGSLFAAFSIRLGYFYYPNEDINLTLIILGSPLLALPIFIRFEFYNVVIRYVGLKALWHINQATALYAMLWGLFAFMGAIEGIPRSVIIINWLLLTMIIAGSRLLIRWLSLESNSKNNVLIYGAGSAGRQLNTTLKESKNYKPVAFIDNSAELHGHSINGLTVFSEDVLEELIKKNNIKEVFLAIPSLSRIRRNEIISVLKPYPVIVRSLPSLLELVKGKFKVNELMEIDVNDLLGRESASPNKDLLKVNITSKSVMITGAGGSIGSELCRQIILLKPKKIILYEINEFSLYKIEQELLNNAFNDVKIFPVLGSIRDKNRITKICKKYGVKTIYHAAAYKHVPLVEANKSQGVLNNSIGTMILAEAAISANVETFVLISTDKAVRPTSIMGASKRIAELVLQALSKQNNSTCFTMVRFGNVLDSSGSVIPLFKHQIKLGGPLTVTHEKVTRYFMTIPEAVELVIQSGSMAKGGEVFLLDMGEPIRIYDLAVKMIQLSGLQVLDEGNPNGDIEIKYTGLRPGEKLFEELLVSGNFSSTDNQLIMRSEEKMINWDQLKPILCQIEEAALISDTKKIINLITQLVPEFHSSSNKR